MIYLHHETIVLNTVESMYSNYFHMLELHLGVLSGTAVWHPC